MQRKKLLLINPSPFYNLSYNPARNIYPPLGLGYIAALTPKNWDVEIIDENIQKKYKIDSDLVGITAVTSSAPRAYEIARVCKENNIPTVIGGVHVSMLPKEAVNYADSVLIGEAENIWPKIISDFEKGKLKKFYNGGKANVKNLTEPRRDLFSKRYMAPNLIQTSRGCPMNCEFCSVSKFNGMLYRQRPIKDVLNEIGKIKGKFVVFIDDNILGYGKKAEERAINLFKEMVDRGVDKMWGSQASINFADNDKVLKYAAESGAIGFFIGFESINERVLKNIGKVHNLERGVKRYKKIIKKFHDYGIGVIGSFILGDDNDKKDVFKKIVDFTFDSEIDGGQYGILTPLPGTRLYERLKNENRLIYTNYPNDWIKYDVTRVVFKPKNMGVRELEEGINKVYEETDSLFPSLTRSLKTLMVTKNLFSTAFYFIWNVGYKRRFIWSNYVHND